MLSSGCSGSISPWAFKYSEFSCFKLRSTLCMAPKGYVGLFPLMSFMVLLIDLDMAIFYLDKPSLVGLYSFI